ncbi:phosphatidylinositol-specific phospholipase C/glycerophosphodiester phosphodiesterase family protein [Aliarcobacter butzleri]|uniref:phosphatidylinositol-specific phospholipase C/glycerophosphodiester phosphodiesterase family protein n=1 Tax=Aliarcobacter butzleri TaxID=28197 RepID=UPI0021B16A6E|nr:phosphatidylinositol-specific phospholipase C/glycerophosphodiester phosphodiesterase family protein [Aliarcobacter butzleri]MCT7602502.1 hypothetical protein [Aliarcobacter butzleri]MCT7606544.1 hypothetical protein [Aliarcobacter butzleri]MCT7608689.1 hypothetical protein [Aliarcobacter butzleri]
MEYIAHRVNTIEELKQIPNEYGVELDLRDFGDRLILQHDPFKDGEDFEEYLKNYNHGTMILNIKSERIEHKVLELIQKYNIKKYFFLDSSFPMIYLLSKSGEKNIALRFSEFEGIDTILNMVGKVEWIWVDCFSKLPINYEIYKLLKNNGFKFCLVSPELQGQNEKLASYKQYLQNEGIVFDAICTKIYNIEKWN